MGLVQSIFCSITFCVERVLTWSCCAFLIMLLMFTLIVLMVYGISVGYHYAQKELASFAMSSRSTTETSIENRRAGGGGLDDQPVVRLLAVNRSKAEGPQRPLLEVAEDHRNRLYLETSATPVVLLETERAPEQPELSPNEREFAKRLIGRFRRSRNATSTAEPFLRPLRSTLTMEHLRYWHLETQPLLNVEPKAALRKISQSCDLSPSVDPKTKTPSVLFVSLEMELSRSIARSIETLTSEDPNNQLYVESTMGTALVLLETERAPEQLELSQNERDFAKRLIGRFRRSRKAMTNVEPFLRPLRITNTTKLLL